MMLETTPERKIPTGVDPSQPPREIFIVGASQVSGIRNCHWGENLTVQISPGFTPVGHWNGTPSTPVAPGQLLGWQGLFKISLRWG